MSASFLAISAILSAAGAFWLLQVGLDTKHWRLMWLDFFGILDADTTREERLVQVLHIRSAALLLCFLMAATTVSCSFWCVDQIRETQRPKSTAERELEYLRRRAEGMSGR